MTRTNAGYYIQEGFRGLRSHGFFTFAAIGIIAACLIITGSIALVAVNLNHNLNQLMEENEILAYVDETYSAKQTKALQTELSSLDNINACQFISKEEAMDSYLDGLEDDALYADLPASVLRDRYALQVTDITQLTTTIAEVEQVKGWSRSRRPWTWPTASSPSAMWPWASPSSCSASFWWSPSSSSPTPSKWPWRGEKRKLPS